MTQQEIKRSLQDFIVDKLLDGDAGELDEHTPLLEWGVIDSIAMVALLDFIKTQLGAEIPDDKVSPRHFATITALARLVSETLAEEQARA